MIAEACPTTNTGDGVTAHMGAFYRIDIAGAGTPVYAEMSRDEAGTRYSPGETRMVFQKSTPDAGALEAMGCTVRAAS